MAAALNTRAEYKVIVIGEVNVGKTSLILRYVNNEFSDPPRKNVSEETKKVMVNQTEITLQIWDTAGKCTADAWFPPRVEIVVLTASLVNITYFIC